MENEQDKGYNLDRKESLCMFASASLSFLCVYVAKVSQVKMHQRQGNLQSLKKPKHFLQ